MKDNKDGHNSLTNFLCGNFEVSKHFFSYRKYSFPVGRYEKIKVSSLRKSQAHNVKKLHHNENGTKVKPLKIITSFKARMVSFFFQPPKQWRPISINRSLGKRLKPKELARMQALFFIHWKYDSLMNESNDPVN